MDMPKTIEEWNELAAQIKATQSTLTRKTDSLKPNKKTTYKKTTSATTVRSLPIHIVQRPKKGKFKIKSYFMTLLWKKRGYRIFEDFTCQCCGKSFSQGWRYVAEDSRVYLCDKCKSDIKPQFTRILYTPMK